MRPLERCTPPYPLLDRARRTGPQKSRPTRTHPCIPSLSSAYLVLFYFFFLLCVLLSYLRKCVDCPVGEVFIVCACVVFTLFASRVGVGGRLCRYCLSPFLFRWFAMEMALCERVCGYTEVF